MFLSRSKVTVGWTHLLDQSKGVLPPLKIILASFQDEGGGSSSLCRTMYNCVVVLGDTGERFIHLFVKLTAVFYTSRLSMARVIARQVQKAEANVTGSDETRSIAVVLLEAMVGIGTGRQNRFWTCPQDIFRRKRCVASYLLLVKANRGTVIF